MMPSLPVDFIDQMNRILKDEFPLFMETYHQPSTRAFRINTQKIPTQKLMNQVPFSLDSVLWCKDGYYFRYPQDRPGKHAYHVAGLYYIQEASAMAPVEALDPQPGEFILDLCSAPGGKTTQIATKMKGKGLLVANEIDTKRSRILVENIERLGVIHAVMLNESPERLATRFPQFFDRILVDAPCSGEGMFRKDPDTIKRWSPRLIDKCALLQKNILEAAAKMLRPGGRLVYSTCTFNSIENESVIESFLNQHPNYSLIPVPQRKYYQPGYDRNGLTARLWPHRLRGEGHFIAVLQKKEERFVNHFNYSSFKPLSKKMKLLLEDFWDETFLTPFPSEQSFSMYGDHVYLVSDQLPSLQGLKVKRPGFYLGEIRKARFIPSYALAMIQNASSVQRIINFSEKDPDLYRFLQGETLYSNQSKGWTIIAVDDYPICWGKIAGGIIKNHLPKWLRWNQHMLSEID